MFDLSCHFSEVYTRSSEETFSLGIELGKHLGKPEILCFEGPLGSGKTTFIKGIIHSLTNIDPLEILSPTFTYMISYEGAIPICHFDLYRLSSLKEFEDLGFYDYLDTNHLCLVEWPSKIPSLFSENALKITFSQTGEFERKISFSKLGVSDDLEV